MHWRAIERHPRRTGRGSIDKVVQSTLLEVRKNRQVNRTISVPSDDVHCAVIRILRTNRLSTTRMVIFESSGRECSESRMVVVQRQSDLLQFVGALDHASRFASCSCTAGSNSATTSIPMGVAITTSSSIKVNPERRGPRCRGFRLFIILPVVIEIWVQIFRPLEPSSY